MNERRRVSLYLAIVWLTNLYLNDGGLDLLKDVSIAISSRMLENVVAIFSNSFFRRVRFQLNKTELHLHLESLGLMRCVEILF